MKHLEFNMKLSVFTILLIGLLSITQFGFAQSPHQRKGDEFYHQLKYKEALAEYKEGLDKDKKIDKHYASQQIAKSYMHIFDYENALVWYLKTLKFEDVRTAENIYECAQMYRSLEKQDEAIDLFKQLKNMQGHNYPVDELIRQCEWAKSFDSEWNAEIAMTNFVTGGRSFGYAFTDKGLLAATPQSSDFDEHTVYYDLAYINSSDQVNFTVGDILGENINHAFYEATPFLTNNGNTLFYTANASEAKKYKEDKTGKAGVTSDGHNILKIYVSYKKNGTWSIPAELNINDSKSNTAYPFVSDDGQTLFFASDREGGYGKMDIYKASRINDSTWTEPKNLGEVVNSFESEVYPYLYQGKLYFASKGHEGFGGSDMYTVNYSDGNVSDRENLGEPFNSSKDDFGLIRTDSYGYFSSNREGTHGYDHLYWFQYRKAIVMDTLRGEVVDQESSQPVAGVTVELLEKQEDGSWKLVESTVTKGDGKWEFIAHPEKEYQINFKHPDYADNSVGIPVNDGANPSNRDKILSQLSPMKLSKDESRDMLSGQLVDRISGEPIKGVEVELFQKLNDGNSALVNSTTTNKNGKWEFRIDDDKEYQVKFNHPVYDQSLVDIPVKNGNDRTEIMQALNPLQMNPEAKKDNVITINNLYFDFGKSKVQEDSKPILDNLASYLKENADAKVELGAHTDAVGKDDYNMELSEKRANSCKEYLVEKGISATRIIAKGYGETKILNGCFNWNDCTEEENQVNRRVEVKFL